MEEKPVYGSKDVQNTWSE